MFIGNKESGALLHDVARSLSDLDVLLMLMKTEVKKQKAANHQVSVCRILLVSYTCTM